MAGKLSQGQVDQAMDDIVAAVRMLSRLRGQPTLAPAERWSEVVCDAMQLIERSLDTLGPGWDRGSARATLRQMIPGFGQPGT